MFYMTQRVRCGTLSMTTFQNWYREKRGEKPPVTIKLESFKIAVSPTYMGRVEWNEEIFYIHSSRNINNCSII